MSNVKSDNIMFIVTRDKKKYLEPDDDLRRTITVDEFFERVLVIVDE